LIAKLTNGGDHVLNGGAGIDHFDLKYAASNKQSSTVIEDFEVGTDSGHPSVI